MQYEPAKFSRFFWFITNYLTIKRMKLINNRWFDDNNNSWDATLTEDEATKQSGSLTNCYGCSRCSDCSDFKDDPQRILSGKIGSRNAQTTVYFLNGCFQVVCGCFRGNLIEFENAVKSKHTGKHYEDYMLFITKVKTYFDENK